MTAAASPDDQFISAFNDVEHRLRKGAYGNPHRLTTRRGEAPASTVMSLAGDAIE